jgi:hypothetical protein
LLFGKLLLIIFSCVGVSNSSSFKLESPDQEAFLKNDNSTAIKTLCSSAPVGSSAGNERFFSYLGLRFS